MGSVACVQCVLFITYLIKNRLFIIDISMKWARLEHAIPGRNRRGILPASLVRVGVSKVLTYP